MKKHTPAPWRVAAGSALHVFAESNAQPVAVCKSAANAALIAAAPDLLAALETILEKAGNFEAGGRKFKHYFGEAVFNAHAAIAKARGG